MPVLLAFSDHRGRADALNLRDCGVTTTYPCDMSAPALPQHADPLTELAERYLPQIEEAQRTMLLADADVPHSVAELVDRLADYLEKYAVSWSYEAVDPYLAQALLAGLLTGEKGLRAESLDVQRRQVRLALERVRQTLRDVVDEAPAAESTPTKEVVAWLVSTLSVSQADIAELLGTSTRTLQRWLSPEGPTPEGKDEARIRMVARTVAHLRHVFTGPGVMQWFNRPHPALNGQAPAALLDDPLWAPALARLAARSRSTVAS